ncbi:PREDICTED: translation initiation factor IF-2-like [Lepidothrix coronata]|uniref:Translation initiation factor IF-2-like n=1 Tax=Lepidothrix coronata TaxID=321398 RepID=A0A6J0J6R4_9PASS|nr:PREDICTED: translation initiation factor IF-2-like [Lepidothrix coronata]
MPIAAHRYAAGCRRGSPQPSGAADPPAGASGRAWQRPRFLWKRIRPRWRSAARRSRSERRRGLSGPRSPRLPASPSSPLPPLPPAAAAPAPSPGVRGLRRGRRRLACLPGTRTLVTRRAAPRDQWEPFSPRCQGEPPPRPPRERRGKPPFAHAQEENRVWGHANIHPRLPVYPLSAARTRFHSSFCDEPVATGFACKAEGKNKQHKQANKVKKYESNAAPAAAVVRGCGRALSIFPAEQAAGPTAARTAAAALLPPARNSPRFGS